MPVMAMSKPSSRRRQPRSRCDYSCRSQHRLLEYCQSNGLSHPSFVVLDSPLIAYFKPEGIKERALQGTDLKERFYYYLIELRGQDSQVIVIEKQHLPERIEEQVVLTVFTNNPSARRNGFL